MVVTIVILGAAVVAAVAYFAAWILPTGLSTPPGSAGADRGRHREKAGACPDVAPGTASYVHAMPSKEES